MSRKKEQPAEPVTGLKAVIKVERFQQLEKLLSSLVEEARIDVDQEGWTIRTIDDGHIACIGVRIGQQAFESYQADDAAFTLDLDRVKAMLRHIAEQDLLSMELRDSCLYFTSGTVKWKIRTEPVTGGPQRVPEISSEGELDALTGDLIKGAKLVAEVDTHIRLSLNENTLLMQGFGDLDDAEKGITPIKASGQVTDAIYDQELFFNALKGLPQDSVHVRLAKDAPVGLGINAWGGALTGDYLIAPIIESDEDAKQSAPAVQDRRD